MNVKEISWFQKGSFSDMDSVPTRVLRLGLLDRSLTWLVLAPISTASRQRDAPVLTSSSPVIYDKILGAEEMLSLLHSTCDDVTSLE